MLPDCCNDMSIAWTARLRSWLTVNARSRSTTSACAHEARVRPALRLFRVESRCHRGWWLDRTFYGSPPAKRPRALAVSRTNKPPSRRLRPSRIHTALLSAADFYRDLPDPRDDAWYLLSPSEASLASYPVAPTRSIDGPRNAVALFGIRPRRSPQCNSPSPLLCDSKTTACRRIDGHQNECPPLTRTYPRRARWFCLLSRASPDD
jgi:hypothetical protein